MLLQHFKSLLAGAGLFWALLSCSGHYKIDGVVETFGYEGHEVSLVEFLPMRTTRFDSCVVNHGKFQMKGRIDSIRLVFLCKDGQPVIPVYMEKGNVKIQMLPDRMIVSGTRQNDLFYSFLNKKITIDNRFEDLTQRRISMARSGLDSRSMEVIQDSLRMLVDECEEMICSFMATNYKEPAAVGVFMMLSVTPTNEVPPLLKRILDAAPQEFLDKPYVNGYTRRMGYAH